MTDKTNIKSITFFYPSKIVGGAEYLIIRLAKYLVNNYSQIKIYIIDYSDGFLRKNLEYDKQICFIDYFPQKKIRIDYDTFLITFASEIKRINKELDLTEQVKLLFWAVQPRCIIWIFSFLRVFSGWKVNNIKLFLQFFLRGEFFTIKNSINTLHQKNSFVFMDGSNYENIANLLNLKIDKPNYLPVPIDNIDKKITSYSLVEDGVLNITWLGRLGEEKIFSLINIIENSELYVKKYNTSININVIGDGPYKHLAEEYKTSEKLKISFFNTLLEDQLSDFIMFRTDILFAMGTSCLEGARLGIPIVGVDSSKKYISLDYKFRWLYEFKDFSLGMDLPEMKTRNNHSFEQILNLIYKEHKKEEIGNICYKYFLKNHSIEITAKLLLNYLENNNVNISTLENLGIFKESKLKKLIKPFRKIIK